jgi:hypothetical protein
MSHDSTITLERPTPKSARITFTNPPASLIVSETATRLHDPPRTRRLNIRMVVFTSGCRTLSSTTSISPRRATSPARGPARCADLVGRVEDRGRQATGTIGPVTRDVTPP